MLLWGQSYFQQKSSESIQFTKGCHRIMWGDDGTANFFIKKEALEARDFSNAVYQWECW